MSLPTYDIAANEPGYKFRAYGGKDILSELKRKKKQIPTVVLTQFESFGQGKEAKNLEAVNAELSQAFDDVYLETIFYNASQNNWKTSLVKIISERTQ